MTNEEKRAIDLRRAWLREQELPETPWRLEDEREQKKWLAKARSETTNGTLAVTPRRTSSFTPASTEQRAKVKGQPCIVLKEDDPCSGPVQPAHVIDRSLGGDDHEACVVPLCEKHHDAYDNARTLSILEFMEPRYREEIQYAVGLLGLVRALERLTNERWSPDREREDARAH